MSASKMTSSCVSLNPFPESRVTILTRRRRHQALQFDDFPLAPQTFGDPLAGSTSYLSVIGPDETRILVTEHPSVQDDDGNAFSEGFGNGRSQRRSLLGRDDQQIDPGVDEFFNLGSLLQGVILSIFENDIDIGMRAGRLSDVVNHLDPPWLPEIALTHADGPLCRGFGLVSRDWSSG